MLVYGKFSLFLENVAVCSHAFSPLDSVISSQPVSVGLYLGARNVIRFRYFIDRDSVVLLKEVKNWLLKVRFPIADRCDDEADSPP